MCYALIAAFQLSRHASQCTSGPASGVHPGRFETINGSLQGNRGGDASRHRGLCHAPSGRGTVLTRTREGNVTGRSVVC